MWLLNTKSTTLEFFNEAQVLNHPYAILSHVWGSEEVLWHELREDRTAVHDKAGWKKITRFCATAEKYGFAYAWIDTCCIDKRSSADLTEAINSMFKYYYDAAVCFVYFQDVHKYVDQGNDSLIGAMEVTRAQLLSAVRATRWLSRAWTLQELLAPARRCFFAADWSEIKGGGDLLDVLAESAKISRQLIEDRSLLRSFCIGERMSWASKRYVTRGEDVAYSLMGLFDVHMPVMYGEGAEAAFKRLQREIMQSSFDMTIFAWRANYESSGLLARSPADFADVPPLGLWAPWNLAPFSMTNVGLSIRVNITDEQQILDNIKQHQQKFEKPRSGVTLLAALQCDVQTPTGQWQIPMVYLEPVKGARFFVNGKCLNAYRRVRCAEWMILPSKQFVGCPFEDILVLQDEQYELARQATQQHFSRRES
ncbi:HET-domain-containing protein [Annulohypoxylon maeteangense]|uniref:HET-domain-containing protein n=1 Tax=Annulohypoxylon maeteangense TaxID=1927788 RepID=UPI002007BCFA|nr:HET-domain-containing protein [Annulohypoxylon maeteangense]KAI0890102.1 HET-domain-containing protein [Annulohypoxylon maeteangense]